MKLCVGKPMVYYSHDTKATLPSSDSARTSANNRRVYLGSKSCSADKGGAYRSVFLTNEIVSLFHLFDRITRKIHHLDASLFMKKTTEPTNQSPIGENTVLTLTVPKETHKKAYKSSLQRISSIVTVPGFRKGKAPTNLVETHVGSAKILDQVLEDVLPEIYSKAVTEAGIVPLVQPHLEVKELPPEGDWVVTASTAVAPTVTLGDWKKIVTTAGKEFKKQQTDASTKKSEDQKEPSTEEVEQQQLSFVFGKLIEAVNPKIAPLLLEHETRRQIEEFARHLASHRMELDQYLQATGKTVEALQQEYAASSVATLQLEFVLDAVTTELDPKPTEKEVQDLLGKEVTKLPAKEQKRYEEEAQRVLRRRSVINSIKELAK
jgi:FKBP-type peptidyl-prolyl cis-trans isomerase (trigger factor)